MEHSQREETSGMRKGCKDRGNGCRVGPGGDLCRVLRGTSVQCFVFYTEREEKEASVWFEFLISLRGPSIWGVKNRC